jgi:four helix bundle protein
VGANYAEACNAVSKLDFRNKIFIAKKEAAESRYWIDLCIELTSETTWSILRQEVQELLLILQTIVNTLKGGSAK